MIIRVFIFLAALMILAGPASAQDVLRDHRAEDPTAKLLEDSAKPLTANDYLNRYNEACLINNNTTEGMYEYIEMQCGCTTAKMAELMSVKELSDLFTKTPEGNFQQGRVIMLAFMPCVASTVYDYLYDGCFYDEKSRKKMRNPKKTCACYARHSSEYAADKGARMLPGFSNSGYDPAKGVKDPIRFILQTPGFESQSAFYMNQCVMEKESGFGK